MNQEYKDRHVVVTGGTGGLGGAVVEAFLRAEVFCHVPIRGAAPSAGLGAAANDRLRFVAGVDLADEAAATDFYAGLPALWASIHLAGGFATAPVVETSLADFRAQLDLNLISCFLCCREAVRAMRRSPGGSGGRIVNVSARPALAPAGGMIAYSTAKAAVAALTRSLAEEVKAEGIRVNAIVPSIIDTAANRRAMPGADPAAWPKPAEIAEAILFLASPGNALTSGALVPVYGRA